MLFLLTLPLFSSFTSCIEENTRNMGLVAGALVIGGIIYYFSNSNSATPDQPIPDNRQPQVTEITNVQENDNAITLAPVRPTIQLVEQKIDLQQEATPQRPYANPQVTFLKTLKTSLKELEAYQKNHGH